MDKYKESFRSKVRPEQNHETGEYGVQPFRDAQQALAKATFVQRDREVFMAEAYGEILSDLFIAWLKSQPHATKEREYLYSTAMALGSVKEKLIRIETYGNNVKFINQKSEEAEKEDNNG
jgi:hypothetical protein